MRYALTMLVLLSGCGADPVTLTTVVMGTGAGSIAVMQRTPVDAVYSLATGKDCSVVRLDQGKSYCRPVKPAPSPQPYCTRSLGVTDCWADPAGQPPQQADGPNTLTPEQEANRTRRWPF
ncbi:MAG TPA: hypothetical protein VME47_23250 [Acetobacteraceae bacterium]|nr:hypothetical protein [Acetobacteraceae bacterium]